MAEKKITKREVVTMMLADENIKQNDMFVAYLENELALLTKKAENKKATKNQTENAEIKEVILEVLAKMSNGGRATDIMNAVKSVDAEKYATLTNQRVSAIVRGMLGVSMERVEDKRKAYFKKIG